MSNVQAATRAAAVSMLEDFKADTDGLLLQIYRARPASIFPPTAFVDKMSEALSYPAGTLPQRTARAEVIVIHGLFDSGEAVDQRDAFVDGFVDWCTEHIHEAGGNRTIGVTDIDDDPAYVPEWMAEQNRKVYYATRITLEGYDPG